MDTGIDPDHQDLKDRIDASRSVGCQVNGIPNQDPSAWKDDHYHGTHVAGTIAASHNGYGVDGVAPDATLIAIKTSNKAGSFYPEYVACAFDWAAEHNVDVSNSSYYMDPYAFWMPNEAPRPRASKRRRARCATPRSTASLTSLPRVTRTTTTTTRR